VARAPFVSGAERALLTLLRHLDRARVAPAVVLGCDPAAPGLAQALGDLDIPVYPAPLPKRGLDTFLAWRRSLRILGKAVEEFRPHVLHANDVPSCQAMCVIGSRRRLPRVVHVRWAIAARDAAWWARGGAESLLCISAWIKTQLGDVSATPLARARVEVFPDAVDWPAGDSAGYAIVPGPGDQHDPGVSRTQPRACGLALHPSPEFRLGFAGQIIEQKGLDLLIDALALLPADKRPTLLIAGQDTQRAGAYERELRGRAEQRGVAGHIQWLGFLENVDDLYRQVTALACPSRQEPLGLVPLEAARFAVPSFASRVGGFLETIEDGVTGWLVEPKAEAWAEALARVGALDRGVVARAGRAAEQRTRTLYAPLNYQKRLVAIYADLARGQSPERVA
jgi:glycosyltransferase involved in cell wall biosynthesis